MISFTLLAVSYFNAGSLKYRISDKLEVGGEPKGRLFHYVNLIKLELNFKIKLILIRFVQQLSLEFQKSHTEYIVLSKLSDALHKDSQRAVRSTATPTHEFQNLFTLILTTTY